MLEWLSKMGVIRFGRTQTLMDENAIFPVRYRRATQKTLLCHRCVSRGGNKVSYGKTTNGILPYNSPARSELLVICSGVSKADHLVALALWERDTVVCSGNGTA